MTQQALAKKKGIPDIVFLVDTTGSMSPCIDALRANIGGFIDTLTSSDANGGVAIKDWRIRVIGYRDREQDGPHWLIENPFVADAVSAKSQISSLAIAGGGDEPESLLDALYVVASWSATDERQPPQDTAWRHLRDARRVVVVFTDASCKPTFAASDGSKGTVADIINLCMEKRLKVCLFAPETPTYLELEQMDGCEYESIGPLEGSQAALARFTGNPANFQRVMAQLAKSISISSATPL